MPTKRKITILSGPDNGTSVDVDSPSSKARAPGGTNTQTGKQETVDEAVDHMAGSDDAYIPSNAGRQAQSSDNQNGY